MIPFDRVALVGVGLIGGSLGIALRERRLARTVVGCGRSRDNLDVALARGAIDEATTDGSEAVRDADLIVLGVPVGSCGHVAETLARHAATGAILTDVASVKGTVVDALEAVWPDATHVVGAHPIAGSERSGAAAADGALFEDRLCIVTPTAATAAEAVARVEGLWRGVGARVERMSTERHDEVLAWVSHAPHAIAYALAESVGRAAPDGELLRYAGSGFEDTTRIARSSPTIWRDVLCANPDAVTTALVKFREALTELEDALRRRDAAAIERFVATARARLDRGDPA